MLATLCFLLPLPLTHAATKIIYSSDPSIEFSPGWSQEYSQISQDSYMQTDFFPASLTATLPSSASSVSFVAYKRAGGSVYGYCLDCDEAAEATLLTVDGSDSSVTNNSMALESTLFSMDIDPSIQHTLTVYNLPSSEITFDHLAVAVQDGDSDTNTATLSAQLQDPTPTTSASGFSSTPLSQSSAFPSASASSGATTNTDTGSSSVPSSATAGGPGSSTTLRASSTTIPILQHPTSSSAASPSSSAAPDEATTGVSKSLITGLSILAVVLAASIVVGLFVFVRQRRQRRRDSFQSSDSQPSQTLSPTGSLIPIMPPPQMRTASLNPFSDPASRTGPELPLDTPVNSSLMQRRMESRSASPGSAPTIPLPELPLDRPVNRMESRSNSPASAFSRNDLWITRPVQTPVNAQFSAV